MGHFELAFSVVFPLTQVVRIFLLTFVAVFTSDKVYSFLPAEVSMRQTQLVFTCSKSTVETPENVLNVFKVNNKDTRTSQWCRCGVFIVQFEQSSHIALVMTWDK